MYNKSSMRRTHETRLRFSDKEAASIDLLVQGHGGQKATILRELIMEALASNDDISRGTNLLEGAK
jgi:predicted DNA-binding protein